MKSRAAATRVGLTIAGLSLLCLTADASAQSPPSWAAGGPQVASKSHPGVVFLIPSSEEQAWRRALVDIPGWTGDPTPEAVLQALANRFAEMVDAYGKNKASLPSCLTDALDRHLQDLKTGRKQLYYAWLRKDAEWPDLKYASQSGVTDSETVVRVFNAFTKMAGCGNGSEGLTSSLLFHEFIHSTKKAYPGCFKALDFFQNEASTEDAEAKILGRICRPYKNAKYPDYPATYENLCRCADGCP